MWSFSLEGRDSTRTEHAKLGLPLRGRECGPAARSWCLEGQTDHGRGSTYSLLDGMDKRRGWE
jgi:hypothetical protein